MVKGIEQLKRLMQRDEGATAVEYGIMVALIAVVIIAAVFFIGQELRDDFSCVGDALSDPAANANTPC